MKNKPSVGDTVYYYNRLGDRFSYTVNGVTGDTLHFANREPAHYKMFQGRIVKKPRKCGECAKTKELFYIGHNNPIGDLVSPGDASVPVRFANKIKMLTHYSYVSTIALINTEKAGK